MQSTRTKSVTASLRARTPKQAIGEACDAGTSCGTCHERLVDMIESYFTDVGSRRGLRSSSIAGILWICQPL